ncbi:hypothetical protein NXX91_11485 [Bacteroides thetaiotaomicron]|nr:hypothetical protein [Bacteroides thetaiotaomicron]
MRKLLLNLFLSTVGLLFAGQASAQEEIAPGIIKLQAGEIDTFTPLFLIRRETCRRSNETTSRLQSRPSAPTKYK